MACESLVILTGMSGSGKSVAMNALEDIGFYCVDNLPVSLLTSFAAVCDEMDTISRAAVAVDCRGAQFDELLDELDRMQTQETFVDILFLDASDNVLQHRYKQTRRRHPLESDELTTSSALVLERTRLNGVKNRAKYYINTSEMSAALLKTKVISLFEDPDKGMNVSVESFGFKYGIPTDADLVFDVRCMPNPYWEPTLREHTGLEQNVRDYIYANGEMQGFVDRMYEMIDYLLPLYRKEGKSQLTVAVGCTGGHHRSVAAAQDLYKHLKELGAKVSVIHRDIEKN